MRMPMTWRACEITNERSGKPAIVLHGKLKAWFEAQGLVAHHRHRRNRLRRWFLCGWCKH